MTTTEQSTTDTVWDCPHGDTNCKTVLGQPYHGNCHTPLYRLRSRLNGLFGGLVVEGHECANELGAAIAFLRDVCQPETDRLRRTGEAVQATLVSLEEDHVRIVQQLRERNKEYGRASAEVGALRAQLTHTHQQRRAQAITNGRLADDLGDARRLLQHFGAVTEVDGAWCSRCWLCGQVDQGWTSEIAAWVYLDHHWTEDPVGSCGYVRLWKPGDRVQWTDEDGLHKGSVVGPAGKHHVEVQEDGHVGGTHLIPPDSLDAGDTGTPECGDDRG